MKILHGYFGGGSAATALVLALFVATLLPNGGVLAQDDGDGEFDLFDVLPGCLTEETYFDTFRCIVDGVAPDCFDEDSVSNIRGCFEDKVNTTDLEMSNTTGTKEQVEDAAEECFAPYLSCFNETLHAAIEAFNSLHPCVNETTTNLIMCGYENHETCAASCANTQVDENAFDDLNYLELLTCDGIQSNIMDEVCTTASCCPECLEHVELWSECIVNEVLDYTLDGDCDFACSGGESSVRKLKATAPASVVAARTIKNNKERKLQGGQGGGGGGGGGEMPDAIDLNDAMEECIALVPGIHGMTNGTELAARASFFQCVLKEFVEVIEDAADGNRLPGPGGRGGGSSGGGRDPPGDGEKSENGEGKGPDGEGFGVSNTNATDDGGTSGAGITLANARAGAFAATVVAVAGLFF